MRGHWGDGVDLCATMVCSTLARLVVSSQLHGVADSKDPRCIPSPASVASTMSSESERFNLLRRAAPSKCRPTLLNVRATQPAQQPHGHGQQVTGQGHSMRLENHVWHSMNRHLAHVRTQPFSCVVHTPHYGMAPGVVAAKRGHAGICEEKQSKGDCCKLTRYSPNSSKAG